MPVGWKEDKKEKVGKGRKHETDTLRRDKREVQVEAGHSGLPTLQLTALLDSRSWHPAE